MTLKARVTVTIKKDILDPAGDAVRKALTREDMLAVSDVRIGRIIDLTLFDRQDISSQMAKIELVSKKLLANPIMEDVSIEILDETCDAI